MSFHCSRHPDNLFFLRGSSLKINISILVDAVKVKCVYSKTFFLLVLDREGLKPLPGLFLLSVYHWGNFPSLHVTETQQEVSEKLDLAGK